MEHRTKRLNIFRKFIILSLFLLSGCLIIYSLNYFYTKNQKKDNFFHLVKSNKKNLIDKNIYFYLPEKQLVSYFSAIIIPFFIFLLLFFYITNNKIGFFFSSISTDKDTYDYICFIKSVLEMCCYENYMIRFTANNADEHKYQRQLTFSKDKFLDNFLFKKQSRNNKRRQKFHQDIYTYRRTAKVKIISFFYLCLVVTYLLSWAFNFFINLFFNSQEAWKRLKLSSLWMMIPNFHQRSKRIASYSLFLGTFILILIFFIFHHCFDFSCPFNEDINGYRFLLGCFITDHYDKYETCQDIRCHKYLYVTKNKEQVFNILDEKHMEDFDFGNVSRQSCIHFQSDDCKNLIEKAKNYANKTDYESNVFQQIDNFMINLSPYVAYAKNELNNKNN